ncbi:MAG: DMT family transporter, partial [bacterium]
VRAAAKMRDHITDYLLLLLLALIWSASFLLIKIGVGSVGPITLTACRMFIATLVLALCLALRRSGIPLHRRALLLYLVVGFLGNTLPFILISWGETRIDSSLAAIMMGIMPIATFALAHCFLADEPMTARKTLGVCLGFGGLLTLVGWSAFAGVGDDALGQLSVLAAAVSYSVTTVFIRTQPVFSGVQMATGVTLAGTLTSAPLAFLLEDPLAMTPSAQSIEAIVLLAVFPTALASLIYFRVIRNLGATTFSQLNYAIPVLGSLWGTLLLDELLQTRMLFALALVLVGVYFIQPSTRRD